MRVRARRGVVLLLASAALLGASIPAEATTGYGGALGLGGPGPSAKAPTGSLPFTGLDLQIVGGSGLALVGLGLALRRGGRHPTD